MIFAFIAFSGKFIGTIFAIRNFNEPLKNKFLIGIGLSSKGGIELVIATIGINAGLLSQELFSSLIVMSIILTILSPVLFNHYVNKTKWS